MLLGIIFACQYVLFSLLCVMNPAKSEVKLKESTMQRSGEPSQYGSNVFKFVKIYSSRSLDIWLVATDELLIYYSDEHADFFSTAITFSYALKCLLCFQHS